ncbi:MAG TPA: YkvA family protein [Kofleriaceae bacterium]|nr:YkvA family protein [Kofleriaceae bacterium]
MAENISHLKDWAVGWRDDVEILKRVLSAEKADREVRKHAAAALNYLVSRMDLIPDWEPVIGILDDVMVLRVCAASAARGSDEGLDDKVSLDLNRLANQAERVDDILGKDLATKLRAHCDKLTDQTVRGRSPHQLLTDKNARTQLFADVEDALKKAPAVKITDADDTLKRLTGYLSAKLK